MLCIHTFMRRDPLWENSQSCSFSESIVSYGRISWKNAKTDRRCSGARVADV